MNAKNALHLLPSHMCYPDAKCHAVLETRSHVMLMQVHCVKFCRIIAESKSIKAVRTRPEKNNVRLVSQQITITGFRRHVNSPTPKIKLAFLFSKLSIQKLKQNALAGHKINQTLVKILESSDIAKSCLMTVNRWFTQQLV